MTDVEFKRGIDTGCELNFIWPNMAAPGSRSKTSDKDSSGAGVRTTSNNIGEQEMGRIRRRDVRSGDAGHRLAGWRRLSRSWVT